MGDELLDISSVYVYERAESFHSKIKLSRAQTEAQIRVQAPAHGTEWSGDLSSQGAADCRKQPV